ncbi:MAG TPA: EamA family transporter, partial [Gemmataceae bacterium]|nr:EamA family transporter [Gemmataceae bacterium]
MGIFAIFLSTIFSTSKDILSKKLAVRIDGTASTFASFGFALPFYLIVLAFLWFMGYDIFTFSAAFWVLVLFRALTDVFAEGMKMYSFTHGDISLVNIIFSFSPLCVLALTPLLKNDKLSLGGVLAVILVVIGSVALVYRPSHPDWGKQKTAIFLAAGAALFFGLNSIFDKLAMEPEMSSADATGNPTSGMALIVKPAVGGFAMTAVSAVA